MFDSSAIDIAIKTTIENLKFSIQENSITKRENKIFYSTVNFMELVNCNHDIHDNLYVNYQNSSYEEYLKMCQELSNQCDTNQKNLITFIVKEIIQQIESVNGKKIEKESTMLKFNKDSTWGKVMISLFEAFEIPIFIEEELKSLI